MIMIMIIIINEFCQLSKTRLKFHTIATKNPQLCSKMVQPAYIVTRLESFVTAIFNEQLLSSVCVLNR